MTLLHQSVIRTRIWKYYHGVDRPLSLWCFRTTSWSSERVENNHWWRYRLRKRKWSRGWNRIRNARVFKSCSRSLNWFGEAVPYTATTTHASLLWMELVTVYEQSISSFTTCLSRMSLNIKRFSFRTPLWRTTMQTFWRRIYRGMSTTVGRLQWFLK